jgi:hypothetical protein
MEIAVSEVWAVSGMVWAVSGMVWAVSGMVWAVSGMVCGDFPSPPTRVVFSFWITVVRHTNS